jgi:threonine dehydratase
MDLERDVDAAHARIREHVRRTAVERSRTLGAAGDCRVHLKLENTQATGSFKLRGALNKLLVLDEPTRRRGVVAASTGNHGAAVAYGAARLGVPALIFAPESALASKLEAVRGYGAEVRLVGADCIEAETAARAHADERGLVYISPYNDPAVVAGQGTLGRELHEQLEHLDAVYIALGGGGLLGGVGGYLKAVRPDVEVIACSPRNSAVMHHSLAAGRILDLPSEPTLSDGTAGGVEAGSITFELCRAVADRSLLVEEDEIAAAVRHVVAHHHALIEGAAGVAVAGFLAERGSRAGQDVAIVLCGANIDVEVLKRILA